MAYDVPVRLLSITPTRDGIVNPSKRLADKHARLMCGKTLDEWTMLQLWSSRCVSKAVFVCETVEHAARLAPLARKYSIDLEVRDAELLHPINDSGALVIYQAAEKVLAQEYFSLITTPFVVSPLRPPGFFDQMFDLYLENIADPEWDEGHPQVMGYYSSELSHWMIGPDGRARQITRAVLKDEKDIGHRTGCTQHWICATWWYMARAVKDFMRMTNMELLRIEPIAFEIQPWMDIHIDDEDDWANAEYWFERKILSAGEDCYERYRANWEADQ